MFKSGFVSILGRPNVGKSTLMNAIIKQKISIISPTAQTTRNSIKGIYTTDEAQIILNTIIIQLQTVKEIQKDYIKIIEQ